LRQTRRESAAACPQTEYLEEEYVMSSLL